MTGYIELLHAYLSFQAGRAAVSHQSAAVDHGARYAQLLIHSDRLHKEVKKILDANKPVGVWTHGTAGVSL